MTVKELHDLVANSVGTPQEDMMKIIGAMFESTSRDMRIIKEQHNATITLLNQRIDGLEKSLSEMHKCLLVVEDNTLSPLYKAVSFAIESDEPIVDDEDESQEG